MLRERKFLFIKLIIALFILSSLVHFLFTRQGTLGGFLDNEDVMVEGTVFNIFFTSEERHKYSDFDYEEENTEIFQAIFEDNLDMSIKKGIFEREKGSQGFIMNLSGDERLWIYEDMIIISKVGKLFDKIYLVDDNTLFKAIKESDIKWRFR
ncbi:hypothetical protein HYG86_16835 [Alkalicella caledoniensis]|uniref:Uncharacterized protein n=1 Tax=Alkalicella caledoniensis TaxID=2731377 RepID=A0A7G9WCA3_ALKCA|nr:hypothetical protein [Alkalicella caledoniensis]QNO16315.1 hypothetical protein HYG86_16835 [Alkalicella caledoniensis]